MDVLATLMLPRRVTNDISLVYSLVSSLASEASLESAPPFEAALREIRSNPRQPLPYLFGFLITHTGLDDKDKPLWDRYVNNIRDGMAVRWALEPDEKTDLLQPYVYKMKLPPQYASVDRVRRKFARAQFFNDDGEQVQGSRDPTMLKCLLYVDDECLESFQKYEAAIKCFEDGDVNGVVINGEEMEEGEIREDKGWMRVDCKHVLMFWDRVSTGQWDKEYARFARPKRVPWWDRPAWFY
ncbi:hypothetical protein K4K57_000750 [Colletotrichum sp. SAR 10_99]|nr:hypothetical protein K4K57_000750 [Colletotrichum sp. SAR 10_99]